MNPITRLVITLGLFACLLFGIWYAAHQYPNDPFTAATAAGSFCFCIGSLWGLVVLAAPLQGINVNLPPAVVAELKKIGRFAEHKDSVDTIRKALTYYHLIMEIVRKETGEIFVHETGGDMHKIDPITLEICPEETED
jgi:hypothetical protein